MYCAVGVAVPMCLIFGGTCAYIVYVNDFPNRRRFCSSKKKLTGKTTLVTGWHSIDYKVLIFFSEINK